VETIHVGDLVVHPILDGTAVLKSDMWSGSDWTEHQHVLDADGSMTVPVGAFLVRVGDKLLLLDAGVGDTHDEMFDGGALLANLAAAGVHPADIDVVMVSHLHSDHMGWLEHDGVSTFANATIRIGAADWEHFVETASGGRRRAASLRVVESQVELIHHDGEALLSGVTTRATPGHTPGHTSTILSSGTERLIVLGDALHCPAQLTETEWEFLFDVDAALAVRTRQALVREAEQPGTVLLPCHFPGMQAARLLPAQGTKRWVLGEVSGGLTRE
jgi:glyoxylase-like metal-dependent hydrolase (beta-lactamase superfamily II)